MSAVEKLAAAPCRRGCDPKGYSYADHPELGVECSLCGGSGALVPGFRKPCLGMFSFEANTLYPCPGDGCQGCQGRGWGLIPEAESEVMMFDLCSFVEMGEFSDQWHIDVIIDGNTGHGKDSVRLEALAAAVLQALRVE